MSGKGYKRRAVAKIVSWSIILVALVSVFAVFMVFGGSMNNVFGGGFMLVSGFTYSDPEKYLVGDMTYTDEIRSIDIEWAAGDITVKVHDGDDVIVEETGKIKKDADRVRSYIDKGTLYIKYAASGVRFFGNSQPQKNLVVSIPQKYAVAFSEIEIDAASASVSVNPGIICKKLSLECASGNINADIVADEVELYAVSGDLTLRGEVNIIELEGVSGKADLELSRTPMSIDIETVSGDIRLGLPEGASFEAEMESVSGMMQLNGKNVGKYCKEGSGEAQFEFKGVSANVRITTN